MTSTTSRVIIAAFVAFGLTASVLAEEEEKKQPSPEEIEKMFAEFAKVGPQHKRLRKMAGVWSTESKSFYPDPENPTISKGMSTFKVLLGGRFVQQTFKGEYGGQPFQGMGLSGYDNAKKKYVGSWVDSMGTSIMASEGTFDEKTKTLTEIATSSSPIGEMKMKLTSKDLDENTMFFTMFNITPDGKEVKMMEITYKRMKKNKKNKKNKEDKKKED